jgi:hypothetical protein
MVGEGWDWRLAWRINGSLQLMGGSGACRLSDFGLRGVEAHAEALISAVYFDSPFKPGQGDRTVSTWSVYIISQTSQHPNSPSPCVGGCQSVNLGSFAAAGFSELSKLPISSGKPSKLCAKATLLIASAIAKTRCMIGLRLGGFGSEGYGWTSHAKRVIHGI